MDIPVFWNSLVAMVSAVPQSFLLLGTLLGVFAGIAGSMLRRPAPLAGRALRGGSTLLLACVLAFVILQASRFDMVLPELGVPQQKVAGGETRIPLAPDGHFWVRATVNGVSAAFMVDTGATLTAVNAEMAAAAALEPGRGGMPIVMQTANGPVTAQVSVIDELSFGNISARGLDAVIAPNIGRTNVLGMNLLRRLGSWRVEGDTMILVPAAS